MTEHSSNQVDFARVLGRKDVLALAFGAMIGWGWVVLTGGWIQNAGSLGAIIAFLIGGLAIILIGLTYAELAAAMPLAGGEHVYSYRALGHFSSFVCTWSIILGYASVIAFEAVALPTVIDNLFPNYARMSPFLWNIAGWDVYAAWAGIGIIGSIIVMTINYFGVRTATVFQKAVTLVILLAGVMFVSGSLFNGDSINLDPLISDKGMTGVMVVLIMVPFMFVGFDVIPQAAEEVNLPPRELGKLLIISVVMAIVFYSLIILGVGMALPMDAINSKVLTVPQAMESVFGAPWAAKFMILAGLAGIVTTWNALYIGASRAIYALAQAGMLPAFLGKLHPRYKTPTNAILLIGLATTFVPLLGRASMVWLVNAGSLAIVIAYLFVAISFIVLRIREPEMPRPFKVRGGMVLGGLAVVVSLMMMSLYLPFSSSALATVEWAILIGWFAFGLLLYSAARKQHGVAYSDRRMAEELAALSPSSV